MEQPRGYSINLPTFWPSAQVEAQFNNKNIQDQRTRFDLVVASLSPEYAAEIRDVIISPPEESPFNRLKEELVNRTTVSERKRLQQLLSAEVLGDRKPTQFLRHMRQLFGQSNVDSAILSELFLQRLPANVRMILSANGSLALEDKAKMADSIMDVIPSSVNSVLRKPGVGAISFEERLDQIISSIEHLESKLSDAQRSRTNYRYNFRRQRSTSRVRQFSKQSEVCWYHRKFGENAHKCVEPCQHSGDATKSSQ
ncbi:uncharacterized protein LOC144744974 [Ciona intestinalis]